MKRSPQLQQFIDSMAVDVFGWDGDPKHCRTCNSPIGEFRDEISAREFEISGMCQDCQDKTFGGEE